MLPALRLVLFIPAFALAGCAGLAPDPQWTAPGPPWPVAVAPGAITLRWYTDTTSEAQAKQVADAHCARSGRPAALIRAEQSGSAEIATYRCQ